MDHEKLRVLLLCAAMLASPLAAQGCSEDGGVPADARTDIRPYDLSDLSVPDLSPPDLPQVPDLRPDAPSSSSFSFFVLADTRSFPKTFKAAATSMLSLDPQAMAMFNVGDLTWSGAEAEWVTEHDQVLDQVGKGKIRRDLTAWDPKFIRYLGVMGNHDSDGKDWLQNWNKHLPGQKGLGHNGKDGVYFSVDHGGVLFLALDSIHPSAGQDSWLKQKLSALDPVKHRWRLAFMHHPIYPCNDKPPFSPGVPWARLFEKHGFDIVFVADSHTYERTCPMKNGKCSPGGVIYINSSGGGAELKEVKPNKEADVAGDNYHCSAKGGVSGILKVGIGKWHHYTHLMVKGSTLTFNAYSHDATTKPKDTLVLSK